MNESLRRYVRDCAFGEQQVNWCFVFVSELASSDLREAGNVFALNVNSLCFGLFSFVVERIGVKIRSLCSLTNSTVCYKVH